ncbi:MAG: DUF6562 domain-containing protein [Bacilli bacterium]
MKRYLLSTFTIAAAALLVTSCNDEMDNGLKTGDEGTVTFTAQLPSEMGTRAFADGLTAKHLQYAVYEAGQSTPLKVFGDETTVVGEAEMVDLKKSVTLQLTSGKSYDVIFWADATTDSPYTFDPATQKVSVDYSKVNNNSDNCDAFFKKETITVSGNQSVDVKLTRPFAQVNIGTDDFDAAKASGLEVTQTEVVAKAFATLNLATGEVADEDERTFTMKAIPTASDGEFPVAGGYKYLSMDYLLVGADKATVDVAFNYGGPQSRTFTNVPVQRNYRTNIYGSLLTNTTDFNVVIEPAFIGTLGIATDEELADAASHHNRHVQLADNVQLALPTNIAEGVVITGGTNSVLKVKNGYQIPNDNVTFKDVTLARDDSAGASDGCYLKINSDNVVLDNVKLGIINFNNEHSFVGGGIYLNGGKTLTVRNTNFTIQAAYGVFAMDPGTTIILENCNFGPKFQYCTNQPGNGKLIARNTTFRGWMSGWSDGYFENCTFKHGDLWYPYARCYGSSVFKDCEFERLSTATDNRWLPTAPNRKDTNGNDIYDYDYAVSCMKQHSIIEFINCRYSDGSAFNKNVFLKGTTDSSGDPDKVIINGTTYTDINEFTYW